MTFPDYFNKLYKYASFSGEINRDVFFDAIIRHFIYKDSEDKCKLLSFQPGTKTRYVQEDNPRPIDQKHIQYLYNNHDKQRYTEWVQNFLDETDSSDYIETWLKDNGERVKNAAKSCNGLLERIFYAIAYPDEMIDAIDLPLQEEVPDESTTSWSKQDKALVSVFNADYDEVIQTCIGERYAQEWLMGRLPKKIYALHDKWKTKTDAFEDLLLKSDVIAIIGTLQEFCNELNPKMKSKQGVSISMIRRKLRNLYVKVHPDGYVGIFPYEAFIDDWDDGDY